MRAPTRVVSKSEPGTGCRREESELASAAEAASCVIGWRRYGNHRLGGACKKRHSKPVLSAEGEEEEAAAEKHLAGPWRRMRRMRPVGAGELAAAAAAEPFERQYTSNSRRRQSFARGSGACRQQVARFGGGTGLTVLSSLLVAWLLVVAAVAQRQRASAVAQEAGEPEEEVSLLWPHKTDRMSPRESPLIKLELKFPSNGQPVGPPRVSHHPAPSPAQLHQRQLGALQRAAAGKRPQAEQVGLQQPQPPPQQSEQAQPQAQQPLQQPVQQQPDDQQQQQQQQHFESQIATNKSEAQLECDSGQMVLKLNFSEPFKGVVYPDHNRLSPCRFFGDGHLNYELRIPLQGCGSRQSSQRVFVNNVVIRFHRTLELEEDEVKTLICRYPAPPNRPEQLSSSSSSSLPGSALFNGSQTQIEHESQFELVDPSTLSQSPGQHRPGLAIETLSDNLVVGPGFHQHHLLQTGRPYDAAHLAPNRSAELVGPEQPNWWQNQSANQQLDSSPTGAGHHQSGHPQNSNLLLGFIDRMSSVELLFLTSSLMFLFLLLLALAIGYCCYKRQAARESARLTTAILNRGHRGAARFGSPQSAALTGIRCGPLSSGHRRRLLGSYTAGPNAARWVVPQQQPQQVSANRHNLVPSSSSPESDQSARGLLSQLKPAGAHYNAAFVGSQNQLGPQHAYSGATRHDKRYAPGRGARRGQVNGHSALGLRSAALYGHPACQLAMPTIGPQYQRHLHESPRDKLERTKSMLNVAAFDESAIHALGRVSVGQHKQTHTNYRRRQRRATQQQQQVGASSESDPDELERATGSKKAAFQAAPSQPSKLVLKSIEDSFITNLTEIHSQEYMKRNSMQPLHISKWRSLNRDLLTQSANKQPTESPPPPNSQTDAESGHEQCQLSTHTNLRSLTEMDVMFSQPSEPFEATNLLTNTTITMDPHSPTQPSPPDNVSLSSYTQTSANRGEAAGGTDLTSPELAVQDKQVKPSQATKDQTEVTQLPDLILSPEYEHSTTPKLELMSPSSPHNSQSYV